MVTRIYLGGDNKKDGERFHAVCLHQALDAVGIDGATLIPANGVWKGKGEYSWIIELFDVSLDRVNTLAAVLKTTFQQESLKGKIKLSLLQEDFERLPNFNRVYRHCTVLGTVRSVQ